MPNIDIYTTLICPYCTRAKHLLNAKGVEFNEIRIDSDPAQRDAMLERSGGRKTVPQIFIDDQLIGGSDDLYALEKEGKLDALLNPAAS